MQGIKKNVGKWYLEIEEKKPDALGDSFEVVIYENHLRFWYFIPLRLHVEIFHDKIRIGQNIFTNILTKHSLIN